MGTTNSSRADRVVVVDDDARIRDLLRRYLTQEGFEVLLAEDAKALNRVLTRETVDLIVLDLMLPGEDGLSICRRLRAANDVTPIIMLTAKVEDVDRIVGLEVGADDYLPKPFNPRELLARIHAVLRRRPALEAPGAPAKEAMTVTFGPFEFDLALRRLSKDGEQIALTTGEFSMLKALVRHPRQPLSRDKLAQLARGREFEPFDRSLDVQISRLRKMIEPDPAQPRYIQTVWGRRLRVRAGRNVLSRGPVPGQQIALSLFWRTFFLLALLLVGGVFAWVQTFRALEFEPRAVQAAQQIASLVNLSRAALQYADGINRVTVVKTMTDQEAVRVQPREPSDRWQPFEVDRFTRRIGLELRSRLGPDTMVASSVNGAEGLWVGFSIQKDPYWLQADAQRVQPVAGSTWFISVGIALLATVFGSVAIARLINQPLKDLSFAASRIRDGEFESQLDETTLTSEIRQVNMGFNRMARELAKVEEDRAVMLAGISHDLRTPLARLRLEPR